MLKIRFNDEDLARVRVSGALDPMWEIVGSVQLLQSHRMTPAHLPWVQNARERLARKSLRCAARVLAAIAPARSYFPDFLTPDRPTRGFDDDLDHILSTPIRRLRAEIGRLGDTSGWFAGLAQGEPEVLARFGEVVRHYHEQMIIPEREKIEIVLSSHRAGLLQTAMRSGTEEMLDSVAPMMRWQPPNLVADYPMERTIDLSGRGLLLVPSFFCARMPVALVDTELNPVLVYPVQRSLQTPTDDGLSELMGVTRADVLRALLDGAATAGELARRVGVSLPTITHHTAALRNSGLISSQRSARQVVHQLTPLGLAMLTRSPDQLAGIW